jgi:hypothetical protein
MKKTGLLILLVALFSCKKEQLNTGQMQTKLESLKTFLKTTQQDKSIAQLNWQDAKIIKDETGFVGYVVALPNTSVHERKYLVAIQEKEGWECNWQAFKETKIESKGFTGKVSIATLNDKAERIISIVNSKTTAILYYRNGILVNTQSQGYDQDITSMNIVIRQALPLIYHNGIPYFSMYSSAGTGAQATVVYYLNADLPGDNNSGGPGIITVNFEYLADELGLTQAEYDWLFEHTMEASQTYVYLQQSTDADKITKAKEHITRMIADPEYLDFVQKHTQTGDPHLVWWVDEVWVKENMHMRNEAIAPGTPDPAPTDLTWEEMELIDRFPFKCYKIYKNSKIAETETIARMGVNRINDKSDAFRHAYWLALNAKSVGYDFAKLYGEAHESEVPSKFALEKQMDLYNNQVGMVYQSAYPNASEQQLSNVIYNALLNGQMVYLKPINYGHPCFWSCNGSAANATHGIDADTKIVGTNQ